MQLFSHGKNGSQHGSWARAPNDNNIVQHGGHPSHVVLDYSIYLDISHPLLCLIDSCHIKRFADQYHVTISQAQV